MGVLVSAASKYGATGEIARTIGDVLAERGFETTVIPPATSEDHRVVVLHGADLLA